MQVAMTQVLEKEKPTTAKPRRLGPVRVIELLRRQRGLSVAALAECTGICHGTITSIERGEVRLPRSMTCRALEKVFELRIGELLSVVNYRFLDRSRNGTDHG